MSSSLVLAFAVLLMMAVLISERAHRTVLSTAVLFLLGGLSWVTAYWMSFILGRTTRSWWLGGAGPVFSAFHRRDAGRAL